MWSVKGFSPLEELGHLQDEMNRFFSYYGGSSAKFPAVNIFSNDSEVILSAEVPGLKKDDFNITVQENNITIEGERKSTEPEHNEIIFRQERGTGKFTRSFRLPYEVVNDRVKAKYCDGILTVTLPRTEESKPQKINIFVEK